MSPRLWLQLWRMACPQPHNTYYCEKPPPFLQRSLQAWVMKSMFCLFLDLVLIYDFTVAFLKLSGSLQMVLCFHSVYRTFQITKHACIESMWCISCPRSLMNMAWLSLRTVHADPRGTACLAEWMQTAKMCYYTVTGLLLMCIVFCFISLLI